MARVTASVMSRPSVLQRALVGRRGALLTVGVVLASVALACLLAAGAIRGDHVLPRALMVSAIVGIIVGIAMASLRTAVISPSGRRDFREAADDVPFRASRRSRPAGGRSGAQRAVTAVASLGGAELGARGPSDRSGDFRGEQALPTFADVGGMDSLKHEIAETIGLLLEHPGEAEHYGIEWNGILLHGPPGVGKTFFARAIAGEYGMALIHVSTGDLVSGTQGESARNIARAFEAAADDLPCVLFFDEFDTVAQRRDAVQSEESRRMVNQLLASLEAYRDERRLLVMAATTEIQQLEPAVVRPGRFARQVRIDLPAAAARRSIFRAELAARPAATAIDFDEVVRRTESLTPAAIAKIVDTAALELFREAAVTGRRVPLDQEHLLAAIERFGGRDRPTVERWTWDSLILPETTKTQLRRIQAVIEDPSSMRRFGVEPPTGLLMAGPPGTGKTTVAKVLAAQARCSFYAISGADVMSKWVGEAEANIRRLFERARENRPAIVFIDEIDALAARRGAVEVNDSRINQLLAEVDGVTGQRGVFVIGATNRPDQIDPALLRGGRLSRTFLLELPERRERRALLALYTTDMPIDGVDLDALAMATEGVSPADLKALCQEAALSAMDRSTAADARVRDEDFREALGRLSASGRTESGS